MTQKHANVELYTLYLIVCYQVHFDNQDVPAVALPFFALGYKTFYFIFFSSKKHTNRDKKSSHIFTKDWSQDFVEAHNTTEKHAANF